LDLYRPRSDKVGRRCVDRKRLGFGWVNCRLKLLRYTSCAAILPRRGGARDISGWRTPPNGGKTSWT